jgi:hypothetical protein
MPAMPSRLAPDCTERKRPALAQAAVDFSSEFTPVRPDAGGVSHAGPVASDRSDEGRPKSQRVQLVEH